ncbi:MAG: secondary thiamine-phosphate synthase enzyme YjbQ [Planctomycetota bacterium]|jgi:secondary thiamine-phosphate synthase enzyme|nr:secondary thiamine-phosphate synthase enzyme YjbQ [Planctomycetota bacterium]
MPWLQQGITLSAQRRGFHLVTSEILAALPQLGDFRVGMLHLLIQHTSASLSLNENADPDVRTDLERWFSHNVRENEPYYEHTLEGSDDMPAHIKGVLIGASLSLPISQGRLALGTWQGIYLCEHRNHGGARQIVATMHGE